MYLLLLSSALLLPIVASFPSPACTTSLVTGFESIQGPVTINTSPTDPFEVPKLSAINETAWEYWYFDAVSSDGKSGVAITFFKDPSLASLGYGNLRVGLDAVWSNGTTFSTMLFVNESTVTTCGGDTKGIWNQTSEGINFSFQVSNSLKQADIVVAGPQVSGNFSLKSRDPARYPGGEIAPSPTASLALGPLIYWNEAIPAGAVDTSLILGGVPFSFGGIGGHDRNYAPFTWNFIAQLWYWLRIVTGPYTAVYWVWLSAIDGKTYTSAFLTKDGMEIFATTNGTVSSEGKYATMLLQYGAGVHGTFADNSTGIAVQFVDHECGKSWHFEIQHQNIAFEAPHEGATLYYTRFVSTASGGEDGEGVWSGVANSEQNVIPTPLALP
ncbi:Diels-Alderase [Lachnellula subtilissima]|uniref:Diels-Alderase n=1 Tax=Lachnellula subtilissima TaxID=602034 RepID=A0A8H8RGC9_9HELO|nr:Diels-Alderase [Lachnellula subtilissima]